ncbi:hypothetical protein [Tuwongella immobilis]|uniref:Uncharacterized protein n=1 Tax=Tuwongella immobilis TaxID=692036 RepID=A0A6C2YK07_9BACT
MNESDYLAGHYSLDDPWQEFAALGLATPRRAGWLISAALRLNPQWIAERKIQRLADAIAPFSRGRIPRAEWESICDDAHRAAVRLHHECETSQNDELFMHLMNCTEVAQQLVMWFRPELSIQRLPVTDVEWMVYRMAGMAALRTTDGDGDAENAAYLEAESAIRAIHREIYGNPFQMVAIPREVSTPTVVALAESWLAQPDPTRDTTMLPILADAAEDAGCAHQPLLQHLRSGGPHLPGCWAVEALLGYW